MGVITLDYLRNRFVEEKELPPFEAVPVSVCTPLYNSMPFLERYLTQVMLYDWPRDLTSLYFTVQGDDGTYDEVKLFKKTFNDLYRRIKIKRVKQYKGGELPHVRNAVQCRNLMADWSKPDMVFYNDHDNFNPPVSIKRLYQGLLLGADGAAGVYVFWQRDSLDDIEGRMGFTSFMLDKGKMYHVSLKGRRGVLPLELMGRRLWVDSVSCGCFLVTRELLDNQKFFVPYGTTMTDDTAFCLKAREKGYKFIADYGLIVPHWGYTIKWKTERITG